MSINNTNTNKININISEALLGALDKMKSAAGGVMGSAPAPVAGVAPAETGGFFSGLFMKILFYLILFGIIVGVITFGIPLLLEHFKSYLPDYLAGIVDEYVHELSEFLEDPTRQLTRIFEEGVDGIVNGATDITRVVAGIAPEDLTEGGRNALNAITFMFDEELDDALTHDRYVWALPSETGRSIEEDAELLTNCESVGSNISSKYYNKKCYLINNEEHGVSTLTDDDKLYEAGQEPVKYDPDIRLVNMRFSPLYSLTDLDVNYRTRAMHKEAAIESGELVDKCTLITTKAECDSNDVCNWTSADDSDPNDDLGTCSVIENPICSNHNSSMNSSCNADSDLNTDTNCHNNIEICDTLDDDGNYICKYDPSTQRCETVPIYTLSDKYNINLPGRSSESEHYIGCTIDNDDSTRSNLEIISSLPGLKNYNTGIVSEERYAEMNNLELPLNTCGLTSYTHLVYTTNDLGANSYNLTTDCENGQQEGDITDNDCDNWTNTRCYNENNIGNDPPLVNDYDAFSLQDMIPKTFRNMFCYEYDDPRTLEGMDSEITDSFVSLQTNNEVAKALRNSDGCGDAEGTIRGEQDPEILSTWNPVDAEDPCTSLNPECEAIQYNINDTNHKKCVRKPERICNPDIDCENYNNNRILCENSYLGNKFCIWNQGEGSNGECQNVECVNIHDSRCEHIGIDENNYKQSEACQMPETTICEPSNVGKSFGEDFSCPGVNQCPLNYIKDGDMCKYDCLSNSSIDSVYNCPYCVLNTESGFLDHFDVNFEFNWFKGEGEDIQPVDSTSGVYDNTNSSHIRLDISIADYQGKQAVPNIFSTLGEAYGIIRSDRPTDLEGNYPQGGISINSENGDGWENSLLRRQCKSGYTCSEGGDGLNNTCRDSSRITSVSNAELQNTLCFNGRANGGEYTTFNFGEYDTVQFDNPIPEIEGGDNAGTGEQLRCSRTEDTSTLYKQNRGYSPIIQNLFNISSESGMNMLNQAPFLESTATPLTEGKSKYLQRCINNPEVHQSADTFIECKFDENNNCPDDIDTITSKPKCIHLGEFNANTIYNPGDNVGISYDFASLDPTSPDIHESFSEKYIELGLHCESPGYHHDDYSKAKCIAKRYKYSKETLLNLERYLNIYLSKPSPGQPEGQDPVNLDGLSESNISTELFDDRPGRETSVIGNIHPCAAEDGYLNYMEYLRDLKDSNNPYKMELYKKIICQLNTGRNAGEPCQTDPTIGSVLPSSSARDNIKKAWVTAGEPKYKMNDDNEAELNGEPYTLDDYSNDILNKYANYNMLSNTDKRELQNNYRKVYGNMGEQLCLYKVDREANNNIEERNYLPFSINDVVSTESGLYRNKNEIVCSDCFSGSSTGGDLCIIPNCTEDQRDRSNEMCNYDGSCRCSAFNEPENENFYHYNEETSLCELTQCHNGSTLLYKNNNNNVAFKDDGNTPLCDCREESGTRAGGYFGPHCDLNNEDSVNGCHGQSQVWEFSVHGTDYKEIDYIRDKINLQDDEEGLIHLKIVDYLRLRTLYALGHNSEGLSKEELKNNIELFFDNLRTHNNKPTLPYNIFETIPDSHELILFGNSDMYKNEEYDLFRFPYTLKEILAEVHERGDLYSPVNDINKDNFLFPNHRSNSEIDNQNPSYANIRSLDSLFYYFYKNTSHGPTFCDCTKDSSGESNITSGGGSDLWYYKHLSYTTSVPEELILGEGANQKHYRGKNKSHNWGFRCENTTDCQPEPGLGYGGYPIFSSLGHSLHRVLGGRQDVSFLINDGMKIFNENGDPKYTNDNVIGSGNNHDGFFMSVRGLNSGWSWPGTHEVIDTTGCKYFNPETFESTDCDGDTKMSDIARQKSGLNLSIGAEIYDFNSRELAQLNVSKDSGRLPNFIDPKGHSPLLCDCSKSIAPWTGEVSYNKQPQAPTFGDYCQAPLITSHDNPNNFNYNDHFNNYPTNIYDIINDDGSVSPVYMQNGVCYRDGLISGRGAMDENRRIYTNRSVSRKVMAPDGDCGRVGEMTLEYLLENEYVCANNPSNCIGRSGDQITMGSNFFNIGCDSRSSNNSCNGNDCVCNGTSCVNKDADYINYQIKYSYDLENYHKDTDFTGYYPLYSPNFPRDTKTTAYISQLYGDDLVSRNTNINKDYKKRLIPGIDYSKDSVCGCSLDRVSGEGGKGCLEVAAGSDLCSGNGTRLNNGTCRCNDGYEGASCNTCKSTHYGYPNCQAKVRSGGCCPNQHENTLSNWGPWNVAEPSCASGTCNHDTFGCNICA